MSYLGIDVGTSRTKAIAYDEALRAMAESSAAYERHCPQPGWYEIDAGELAAAVRRVIAECSRQCGSDPVRRLSFSVFGGGISAIDSRLQPLSNIISTTDRRAQPQADAWGEKFGRQRTYRITGTTTHASLMLPKILWITANVEEPQRIDRFVTAAEIVQAALGVRPRMDLATASTTMLLDIQRRQWSDEILSAAGIPAERLPELVSPGQAVDTIPASVCEELGLARHCVLVAGGHDQQVCALGAGLVETNQATDSLGTVECITTLFARPMLRDDLLENNFSNLLHVHGGLVASLAYNFCSGDLFAWLRNTLFAGTGSFADLFARLPARPSRVLVLPHFAGSGTPHLDALSKGLVAGLTLQTTPEEILRGAVDSNNYEMRSNLDVWRRNGIVFDRLRAYGQGAASDALLQVKADVLNLEVQRTSLLETGCLGAALLAAQDSDPALDVSEVLARTVVVDKIFAPRSEFAEDHERAYQRYQQLYPRLRDVLHEL